MIAMAIMLLGILAANFLSDIIRGTVKAGGFEAGNLLGSLTRWAIIIFAVIAALSELQIAQAFLLDLFRAVIAMIAVAGGLAFGLGGMITQRKFSTMLRMVLLKNKTIKEKSSIYRALF